MSLVDVTTAKLHLRVDTADEDTLIAIWLGVADQQVAKFLNRNVYVDGSALTAAIAAAPAALAAATVTYDAAIVAAELLAEEVDRKAAKRYAEDAYTVAKTASDMAQAGIVVNDSIKAAILLIVGDLYGLREDTSVGVSVASIPQGARSLLMPYRVAMGF